MISDKRTIEEDYNQDRSWSKFAADLWLGKIWRWEPFIEELRSRYLRDSYLSGLIDDEDDRSQRRVSLQDCFVNLALVDRELHAEAEKELIGRNFEKDIEMRYMYEDLLEGETFTFRDVFDREDIFERRSTGWAFIVGSAGTGKSTLLQYVSYRWALKDSWWNNRFEFIFRVRLNHLTRYEKEYEGRPGLDGLSWLIYRSLEGENNELLPFDHIKVCLERHKDRILLLLDGFDEIYSRYRAGGVVTTIIRFALTFPNGILTARPRTIPESCLPVGGKVRWFENLGLKKEHVEVYIKSYFSLPQHDNERRESLSAQLSSNPEMMSLAQIPVNLSAMCLLWSQEQKSISCASELYTKVVMLLARRYVSAFKMSAEEKDAGANVITMTDEQVLIRCEEEFNALSALSYEAFVVRQVQTIDSKLLEKHFPEQQMLINISKRFGLLRPAESIPISYGYSPHYFIHLTYQEYFMAFYIAQKLSQPTSVEFESVRKLIKENKESPIYKVIWKFVSGLISSAFPGSSEYFWEVFLSDIISCDSGAIEVVGFHEITIVVIGMEDIIREGVLSKNVPQLISMMRSLIIWEMERDNLSFSLDALFQNDDVKRQRRQYQRENDLRQLDGMIKCITIFDLFQECRSGAIIRTSVGSIDRKRLISLYQQSIKALKELLVESTSVIVKLGVTKALRSLEQGSFMLSGKEILINGVTLNQFDFSNLSCREEFLAELIMLLVDSNKQIRESALSAVTEACIEEVIGRLCLLLQYRRLPEDVRRLAVEALACPGPEREVVIAGFLNSLKPGEFSTVQEAVIAVLERIGVGNEDLSRRLLLLVDDSAYAQWSVIDVLGRLKVTNIEIIEKLLMILDSGHDSIRSYAAEALGRLGLGNQTVLSRLLMLLDEQESFLRTTAMKAICLLGLGKEEVLQRILFIVKNPDDQIRSSAVEAVVSMGVHHPPALRELLLVFKEKDYEFLTDDALTQVGKENKELITVLLSFLDDRESCVRWAAVTSLGHVGLGNKEVLARLLMLLEDKDRVIQQVVVKVLGKLGVGNEEVARRILTLMDEKDLLLLFVAIPALGNIGVVNEDIVKKLFHFLNDELSFVQMLAAESLGSLGIGSQEVVTKLISLLTSPYRSNRCKIAEVLGRLGQLGGVNQEVLRAIMMLLRDEDKYVRMTAVEAFMRSNVQNEAIIKLFGVLLEEEDDSIWRAAVDVLTYIQAGDQPVIGKLLCLLNHHRPLVRGIIVQGVVQLIGEDQAPSNKQKEEVINKLLILVDDQNRLVQKDTVLMYYLTSPDISVLCKIVEALGKLGGGNQEVVKRLLQQLERRCTRCETIKALGRVGVGNQEVLTRILLLLDAPYEFLRSKALGYLGVIDAEKVIKKILPLINVLPVIAIQTLLRLGIGNEENIKCLTDLMKGPFFHGLIERHELDTLVAVAEGIGHLGLAYEEIVGSLISVAKGDDHVASWSSTIRSSVEHVQYTAAIALGRLDFTGYQFPAVQSLHSSLRSQSIRIRSFFTFTDSTSTPHGEIKLDRTTPVEHLTDLFVRLRRSVRSRPDQFLSLPIDVLSSPAALYGLVVSVWMHRANLIRSESGLVLNGKEYPIETSALDSIWASLLQRQEEFFRATGMGESLRILNQPISSLKSFEPNPVTKGYSAVDTSSSVEVAAFLSHDWGLPTEMEKRFPKHDRVAKVHHALKGRGMMTWLDDKQIHSGDRLFYKIVDGINKSSCFIVFVTRNYMNKVNGTDTTDACQCEFNYGIQQKKRMIAVIMEKDMKDMSKWEGVFAMFMGWTLYLNFCDIDENDRDQFDEFIVTLKEAIET